MSEVNLGDKVRVTDKDHPNHDTEATVVGLPTPKEGSPCHCECQTLDGKHTFSVETNKVAVVTPAEPKKEEKVPVHKAHAPTFKSHPKHSDH